MTREEAIKIIEVVFKSKEAYKHNDSVTHQALNMAIEALQEPKIIVGIDTPYGSDMGIATLFKGKDDKLILEEVKEIMSVVRCKDCRWYDNGYGDVCHNPRYGDGYANYQPPYVDEDYWCKDGERKGGDSE